MNKKLTPLEAFENIIIDLTPHLKNANAEEIKIVETALKNKEAPEEETVQIVPISALSDKEFEEVLVDNCPEVRKKLKALEIIKKKLYINCDDNGKCIELKMDEDQYCDYSCIFCDTKEEYELLKEILK